QFPYDTTYPYYLNWKFEAFERGMRINERLESMTNVTPDSLRLLQSDNLNLLAQYALPILLKRIPETKLSEKQKKFYQLAKSWDFRHEANSQGASVFITWWREFMKLTWDEFLPESKNLRLPGRDRTLALLLFDSSSRWFDIKKTATKETVDDIALLSLQSATDTMYKKYGEPGPNWEWAKVKGTDILHLARIPAFSKMDVIIGGGAGIVNATTERTGPSWRMVVALGPEPKAYGLYPGGQSGNPGSKYYDSFIEKWRIGELYELLYLKTPQTANPKIISTIQIIK
ncbi:MAG: penicillin acylase family protein, partial [Bacteroidia bacterium]|nr:penicillin acylase family protein [Bacteroidia bacterium]